MATMDLENASPLSERLSSEERLDFGRVRQFFLEAAENPELAVELVKEWNDLTDANEQILVNSPETIEDMDLCTWDLMSAAARGHWSPDDQWLAGPMLYDASLQSANDLQQLINVDRLAGLVVKAEQVRVEEASQEVTAVCENRVTMRR